MRIRGVILKVLFHLRRDQYSGNSSAGQFGEAAAGMGALPFIPCEDNEIGFACSLKGGIQFIHLLFDEAIGKVKAAIMGGVTNIRSDEDEVG